MIRPTVGRIVWFYVRGDAEEQAAIVTKVWNERLINVTVFSPSGAVEGYGSIRLLQDEDPVPAAEAHCRWMPYQTSVAQRTEALEKTLQSHTEGKRPSVPQAQGGKPRSRRA